MLNCELDLSASLWLLTKKTTTETQRMQKRGEKVNEENMGEAHLKATPGFKLSLRTYDALFDVSLPRFVISYSALGLFASQLHLPGYVVDALRPILFLVKPVTRRP